MGRNETDYSGDVKSNILISFKVDQEEIDGKIINNKLKVKDQLHKLFIEALGCALTKNVQNTTLFLKY